MNYETLRQQINQSNEYSTRIGLVVTELTANKAKTEMPVTPEYYNPFHAVHGGILFTVADVTGGVAALTQGSSVCTVDSNFHYLNPGLDTTRLYATAQALRVGKRLMVYDVLVYDDKETLLCKGTFTYSKLKIPLPFPS